MKESEFDKKFFMTIMFFIVSAGLCLWLMKYLENEIGKEITDNGYYHVAKISKYCMRDLCDEITDAVENGVIDGWEHSSISINFSVHNSKLNSKIDIENLTYTDLKPINSKEYLQNIVEKDSKFRIKNE